MFTRRYAIKGALAAACSASIANPTAVLAQKKIDIRFNEVVRAMMYGPVYIAITNGYFSDLGLNVSLTTAQGGDKSMAALLSGAADIALIGPETAIYVLNSESPTKVRMFCGLTSTDSFILMSRTKVPAGDWSAIKGAEILGFRPGSTPLLYLESALRKNGIDPQKDVKLQNNIAIPARVGAWLAGQQQFGIFTEPDASQLELDGKAFVFASIGETVGLADYTAFMATDQFIRERPEVLQLWTNAIFKAQKWAASASVDDVAKALAPFFPGIRPDALRRGVERYRTLKIWKTTPVIEAAPIERFQDILVEGNVLEQNKRRTFPELVYGDFAIKAK